jgi:murein DD-endopeptidase MepM/ murein hydrolase activator NlpD
MKMISVLFVFLIAVNVYSFPGYPSDVVTFSNKLFAKNNTCFPFTVLINEKDYEIQPGKEIDLVNVKKFDESWWVPGLTGPMYQKTVKSPLKGKSDADSGPDSSVTHSGDNKYSYDFVVPEGTEVLAMESGVVARIVQHYESAHQDLKLLDEVNVVEIVHEDGSYATYAHLKPASVKLKICDKVSDEQLIGLSGHNGYSSGPHLHVSIKRPSGKGKSSSIPLRFLSR